MLLLGDFVGIEAYMRADIELLNSEISGCLKAALAKRSASEGNNVGIFLKENLMDLQVILDMPVLAPCYILFAVAHEINAVEEIWGILRSYEWELRPPPS